MAEEHMKEKIQSCLAHGSSITEDQVRSMMILVRKCLELLSESERQTFLTLNLFCNWCAHVEITQSNTGLRILAKINDTLSRVKNSTDTDYVLTEISNAVGLSVFRTELIAFLTRQRCMHRLDQSPEWDVFLRHLLEVICDVPLAFPPIAKLKEAQKKIYDRVVQNPIKPGAGVIQATISRVDYGVFGTRGNELWCILIKSEDTTTLVAPLVID